MPSLFAFATPFAFLLPFVATYAGVDSARTVSEKEPTRGAAAAPVFIPGIGTIQAKAKDPESSVVGSQIVGESASRRPIETLRRDQVQRQIRVEQRVILRVTPRSSRNRNEMLASLPREEVTTKFEERKMGECIEVEGIAGVQTGSGSRLLLFLRDQRIVTVNLEKACRSRDFYSGFYIERPEDGKMCVGRDKLHSRTGAICSVDRIRQLVAVED